jgi:hypothetical protein
MSRNRLFKRHLDRTSCGEVEPIFKVFDPDTLLNLRCFIATTMVAALRLKS